jgi:hypothetical protein
MAVDYLSIAFEIIDLSNMAWMVTKGVESITEKQRFVADEVKALMDGFPEKIDFASNTNLKQPLGLPLQPKSKKLTLTSYKLVEIAKLTKSEAKKADSREFLVKANKILRALEICNSYTKDREFFEQKSAILDSANPYGNFMA